MKQKLALVLTFVVLTTGAFAQMNNSGMTKKPALFGIHLDAVDFTTPITLKDKSSSRLFANLKDMDWGVSVSYWKGLTNTIDFSTKITALLHDYAADRNVGGSKTEIGLELEPSLNIRPFKDNNIFNPFLTVGIGGGYYSGEFGAYAPAGVGLQFNFNSVTYLMIQGQYRFTLTKDVVKDNLFYSIGLLQNFGPEKPLVVPPPPPPPDPVRSSVSIHRAVRSVGASVETTN